MFLYLQSFFRYFINLNAVELSSPDVGSSRSKIRGLAIRSKAIDVRLRSPPERPVTNGPPTGVC